MLAEVVETLALAENRSQTEITQALITEAPNTTIQAVVTHIATPNADFLSGSITIIGIVVNKVRPIHTECAPTATTYLPSKLIKNAFLYTAQVTRIKENGTFILKNPYQLSLDEQAVI